MSIIRQRADLLIDTQCELGEGPLWADGALFWFDILGRVLHRIRADGSQHTEVSLNEYFSAAATTQDHRLLLASESALWTFDCDQQRLIRIQELQRESGDGVTTRTNDGRADRHGGFWISTMGLGAQAHAGSLYRFYRGELRLLRDQLTIPNAICFNPSGDLAYFADTADDVVYSWQLDGAGWPVGQPQTFISAGQAPGRPDGAVVDSEGGLWNARWSASCVLRFDANGQVTHEITLPVSCPTCPAFGGTDNRSLYITTAWEGFTPGQRALEPHAGGVFVSELTISGLPDGKVTLDMN